MGGKVKMKKNDSNEGKVKIHFIRKFGFGL